MKRIREARVSPLRTAGEGGGGGAEGVEGVDERLASCPVAEWAGSASHCNVTAF